MSEQIHSPEELATLVNNTWDGTLPDMEKSSITFKGQGNLLFIEDGVSLRNSSIVFEGDNGVVYLSSSRKKLTVHLNIWDNSSFFIGGNAYTNPSGGGIHAVASERRAIVIGDDALMSFGIWMRTSDPHLVYGVDSMSRLNEGKNIIVGDHVWLGQEALLLKGTVVGSGSIVSARAVCANKAIPSNTSWAGNPARMIATNVFFSKQSAHAFSQEQSDHFMTFSKPNYIFHASKTAEEINRAVDNALYGNSPEQRLSFFKQLRSSDEDKDRFSVTHPSLGKGAGMIRRLFSAVMGR